MVNTKWHFVKLQTWDGKWFTYFAPSENRLKNLIQRHNPKNCYISVNQFLRYKEHNPTYPNILFKKYQLIDIDGQNFNSKGECRQYFIDLVAFLKSHNIQIEEMVCTNESIGGYQLLISPDSLELLGNLIENHPQRFFKVDKTVLADIKRVRRLVGTYNGNRASYSYNIDEQGQPYPTFQGYHPIGGTPSGVPPTYSLGMPSADDNTVRKCAIPPFKTTIGQGSKSNLPYHIFEITNNVYGTKGLYIPVLKAKSLGKGTMNRVKRIQQQYDLGTLHIMQNSNGYDLFSLKCVDARRLGKILKAYQYGYNFFLKYHLQWIQLGEFKGSIESECNGNHSKPHNIFFRFDYNNLIGADKLKVFEAVIQKKG